MGVINQFQQPLHMQSDYSGQGVNWILTGRSDTCSPVVGSLSKWWTIIQRAAWSLCNLLRVTWRGERSNRLPITCDITKLSRGRRGGGWCGVSERDRFPCKCHAMRCFKYGKKHIWGKQRKTTFRLCRLRSWRSNFSSIVVSVFWTTLCISKSFLWVVLQHDLNYVPFGKHTRLNFL